MQDTEKRHAFGAALMQDVRDGTIDDMEKVMQGEARAPYVQSIVSELQAMSDADRQLCYQMILLTVDKTIGHALSLFEDNRNDFFVGCQNTAEQENISENSDGFSGELYTEDGWVSRFSQKPKSILTKL